MSKGPEYEGRILKHKDLVEVLGRESNELAALRAFKKSALCLIEDLSKASVRDSGWMGGVGLIISGFKERAILLLKKYEANDE